MQRKFGGKNGKKADKNIFLQYKFCTWTSKSKQKNWEKNSSQKNHIKM